MRYQSGARVTPENGTLTVIRGHGRRDQLRDYKIWIDGTAHGGVAEGNTRSFSLTPGLHEVRLTLDWAKSKTVEVRIGEGSPASLYCRPTGGRVLAPILRRSDYVEIRFIPWADDSPYVEQWGRRYVLAFGGAIAIAFVESVALIVAGVGATAGGVVVAASVVGWICFCILSDIPVSWTRRE
jgi:hypothetical protein